MPVTNIIEGFIYDNQGGLIPGVSLQLAINATGQTITEPFIVDSGYYSAWTDQNPYEIAVVFKKKGYQDYKVQFSLLMQNPTVILNKSGIPWAYILLVAAAVTIYYNRTKKVGKLGTDDLLPIALIIGGVLGFSLIRQILETIGIWDSADTKSLDNAAIDPLSWWNPGYYKTKPFNVNYTRPITTSQAQELAKQLYNSFGFFNDEEESAISVFRSLPSKAAGSFLSDIFTQMYNQDLLTFLRGGVWPQDRLSDADVNTINQYVNNLPNY